MFMFLIFFKVVQLNETYTNPRIDFKKREKELEEHQKKIRERFEKVRQEYELKDFQSNDTIEFSTVELVSIDPSIVKPNVEQTINVVTNPFFENQVFCRFGKTLKFGTLNANGTVSCPTPILTVGDVYLYLSSDKKKWTVPKLLVVKEVDNEENSSSNFLLVIAVFVLGFIIYRYINKKLKRKKGRKHRDVEDPMLQQDVKTKKKHKKHNSVKERDVRETV